ncbi:MAG: SH3 domain-containing protein [Anaerolineales bacterium]|nr:SH3 domain-containing protein [Anaerolineales bacterium]
MDSILDWFQYSLESGNTSFFSRIVQNNFGYAFYIEGGQSVTKQEFLNQLGARLGSNHSCTGYRLGTYSLEIWTSGWSPNWQMTESCYIDCQRLNPPHSTDTAGFLFSLNENQTWSLTALYLNTPDRFYFEDVPLNSCSRRDLSVPTLEVFAPQQDSCPGAPPQQLRVGDQAHVCTRRDSVYMREGPGRSASRLRSYSPGSTLSVIGGPVCSDNWSWWQVRDSAGREGWMAEGGDDTDRYFLCPGR